MSIFIGLAGICLCYPLQPIAWIFCGRFLGGLSTGLFSSTIPRYYEETIPSHLYDRLAPIVFTFSQTISTVIAYNLGSILPPDKIKKN